MTDVSVAPSSPGYGSKPYRTYVLCALLVIFTFNVMDRILLSLVQERIKTDLHVTDFYLGLLGGPFFAVFYTVLGVPIARYAERANRISIVAAGAVVWSAATTACGFAQNYAQLALARMWVGVGEAACTPPSHSAIADYFPSNERGSAFAAYGLSIPLGTMLAATLGGWLAHSLNWRMTFWFLGAPGVLAAIILKLTVKEPPRAKGYPKPPGMGAALRAMATKTSFWQMGVGGTLLSIFSYALTQFLVSYFVRNFALSISTAAYAFGAISAFAMATGIFLGGFISDRLALRHPRVLSWLPALGVAIATPLYVAAFLQTSFAVAFAILLIAPIFHYFYFSPLFTVAQNVAPPTMRATSAMLMLSMLTFVGYGIGPPLVGALADHFTAASLAHAGLSAQACAVAHKPQGCGVASANGLRLALLSSVVFLPWASLHLWLAGRTLVRDREA